MKTKTVMTKEEFKARWESDENGGGILFDDVAKCAIAWGISSRPKTENIHKLLDKDLDAANCNEKPSKETQC